jgi:hemerythrin-like domain-containing protein
MSVGEQKSAAGPALGQAIERWWQDHGDLDYQVGAVVHALTQRGVAAASAAIEDFADALEDHLGVEEEVYFPLIERLAPKHAPAVQRARFAHLELRDGIDKLREQLMRGELEPARRSFTALIAQLRSHEKMEGRVIADLARSSCAGISR